MRRAWVELGLVIATGAAHLVFENVLHQKAAFIGADGAFWLVYIAWRLRTPGQARDWGMRADTFRPALLANALFFLVGAAGMVGYGLAQGRALPSLGFFYLLALYPIWGFIQQFLLCALIGGNLRTITGSPAAAVAIGTLLFGLVHAPDWILCGLTAGAGIAWLAFYFRWPNLWAQG
jgi:hypothetical protein